MTELTTPARNVEDDLVIILDDESETSDQSGASKMLHLLSKGWLLPLVPWLWYIARLLHPVFELAAIALPIMTGVALVIAVGLLIGKRSLQTLALTISLAAFFAVAIVLPGRPTNTPEPTDTFRLASANLARQWFSYNDIGWLVFNETPDLFIASEMSNSHDEELRERFTFGVSDLVDEEPNPSLEELGLTDPGEEALTSYRRFDQPSIGVYSNYDITRLEDPLLDVVEGGLPGMRLRVDADAGEFILYALHIPKIGLGEDIYQVGISEQREMVEAITRAAASEELPVVIAGDLNIVDRGQSYQELTGEFDDAMRQSRWATATRGRTLLHSLLLLRIDHVLTSSELCVASTPRALDVFFTDHSPLIADLGPCE